MFSLGELLLRADVCVRLGVAWSDRAVVSGVDGSIAIIINEKDAFYTNVYEPQINRLTMQGRDDVRGEWIEDPSTLIRLFLLFSGQQKHQYLGRVRFIGLANWGTPSNPARVFQLLDA